jgi:hypothetical protein
MTSEVLSKVVPLELLKDMPRPFVLRLREIREKQLEARRKAEENHMQSIPNNSGSPIFPNITREDMEEFMEEAL